MSNKTSQDSTLKLLVLCQLFYPELISTGQTLTELCEELVDMGVDIDVVCGYPTIVDRESSIPSYMEHRGIRIKRVWGTRFPKLNLLGKIINQTTYAFSVFFHLLCVTSKRPILVLTNPPFLAVICALLRKVKRVPYIFLVFDVYPEMPAELGLFKRGGLIFRFWNFLNGFILSNANFIIVIGRCMRKIIADKLPAKQASKIRIIHVWSDDSLIQNALSQTNPYRKQWNLQAKFVVSYSGNMARYHDMETIMETAKEMRDFKDIVFLFVGEGQKKAWMQNFVERWKLSNCQFYGYVPRENLGFSLSCADVGLVSLLPRQEGLSVPSKTYGILAAGIPVIGIISKDSEIALMLKEEQSGFAVAPGDVEGLKSAILKLYYNDQLRTKMGQNGQTSINEKYNLKLAAKQYFNLIKELQ